MNNNQIKFILLLYWQFGYAKKSFTFQNLIPMKLVYQVFFFLDKFGK